MVPRRVANVGEGNGEGQQAKTAVVCIRDEDAAARVDGHASGTRKCRAGAGAVGRAAGGVNTRTGESRDETPRRHPADAVIAAVGDDGVAVGVDRHASGARKRCGGRDSVGKAWAPACYRCRYALRRDPADAAAVRVGDENIAEGIKGHAPGEVEEGCKGE